jgi:hypothetical protein
MSEFEVKVIGAPRERRDGLAKRSVRRLARMIRAVLLRPRALILPGLALYVLTMGTPHVGFEYECNHPMRGIGTCRSVSWCAYYGIQGRRVEFPEYGESCTVIAFLPLNWNKLMGGR